MRLLHLLGLSDDHHILLCGAAMHDGTDSRCRLDSCRAGAERRRIRSINLRSRPKDVDAPSPTQDPRPPLQRRKEVAAPIVALFGRRSLKMNLEEARLRLHRRMMCRE